MDFSSAAQGVNADPWPAFTLTLNGAENKIVAMVAHIGAQTYAVTAAGIAMVAGPVAGPADGTNGFVRSWYLDRATVGEGSWPAAGNINIVVDPNAAAGRGACGAWALENGATGAPSRSHTDLHATGPTTAVTLASVPADTAILSGFVNNTSSTAGSVAGAETQDANFDGVGGTANQVFASSTPTATGTVTHTFTSPGVAGSYCAALMLEILPGAGGGNGGNGNGGGPFITAAFYPEYASDTVPHASVPWTELNEIYYFGCTWRTDYTASLNITTDAFTAFGHPFTNGQTVQLIDINGSATPVHSGGSLAYDTNYFVRDVSGDTFKLALTSGGAAINFTGAGASNGRRFKAPGNPYINRYEFEPPVDAANVASVIAARNTGNPSCKVYLAVGRDHSVEPLKEAMDYGGAVGSRAGLPDLISGIRAIFDEGFDGIVTDIESMAITGVDGKGGDGIFVYDLHVALRAEFGPSVPIDCFFTRSGPTNTMEVLADTMIGEGLIDAVQVNGYALSFPGTSGSKVWHHGALHHDVSDFGTPTGNTAVGQIETIGQYTTAGVPIGKIKIGLQAGGVPWVGGDMTAPAGSVNHGARFPLDDWSGGGTIPVTDPEVTYRAFLTGTLAETGSAVDADAVAFYAWKTNANPALELFWSSENPTTAAAKRTYWEAQGAGGFFMWQLAGDSAAFAILAAMGPPA